MGSELKCCSCGSHDVSETREEERFMHGMTEHVVIIPVCRCRSCGFQFTDDRAEQIRYAAVTEQVAAAVRKNLQLKRAAFLKSINSPQCFRSNNFFTMNTISDVISAVRFKPETARGIFRSQEFSNIKITEYPMSAHLTVFPDGRVRLNSLVRYGARVGSMSRVNHEQGRKTGTGIVYWNKEWQDTGDADGDVQFTVDKDTLARLSNAKREF